MKALWNKTKTWLNTNNHLLWVSIIALVVLGLLEMYFIGPYQAARVNFEPNIFFNKFWPFALVGTIILFAFSKLSKKWVVRISWILGIFAFLLMLSTIVWPHYIAGSSRYAFFLGGAFDPYAIMLPPYIVLMSHWLSKDKANRKWTTIGTVLLTLFIVFAAFTAPYIFMVQVYLLLFIIMAFKARKNVPWVFYTGLGVLIVFAAFMALAIMHYPHVQHRIMQMFSAAPVNSQTYIAQHALTSSAIVGSTTESLHWLAMLPESVTDYMFTGMIAKFGILMGLLILALYGCIAKGLTNAIQNTKDKFNKMFSTGALGMFAIYTIMGLLVAFGVLATAAYWPFIGFGGTMLLTWCVLFGFVMALNKPTKEKK